VVYCQASLMENTVTQRALLSHVLRQGTRSHPSYEQFHKQLEKLYGAQFSIDCLKKGDKHILRFYLEIVNDLYVEKEGTLLEEAVELLNEVIFHPYRLEGKFPKDIVEREKKTLQNKIETVMEDRVTFSNIRLIDEMCTEEAFRLHTYGYVKDLYPIDEVNLASYYERMVIEDKFDLYVIGNFSEHKVNAIFEKYFPNRKEFVEEKVMVSPTYKFEKKTIREYAK